MGKGKILKRTIAWALALAMVLGMLPYGQMGSVLAASDELLEVCLLYTSRCV